MRLAREGLFQMTLSTILLGAGVWLAVTWFAPATIPLVLIWGWSIAFFRDPKRQASFDPGVMCAPADGTVADITRMNRCQPMDAPAICVGIFLSLFDVHINRWPCSGTVRSIDYLKGRFLPAMNRDAGRVNESNTIVVVPDAPLVGPVVVRQIAGIAARRIVCRARVGSRTSIGQRFGLIKFGSRTELIVPEGDATQVLVQVGQKVRAGLTPLIRQGPVSCKGCINDHRPEDTGRLAATSA